MCLDRSVLLSVMVSVVDKYILSRLSVCSCLYTVQLCLTRSVCWCLFTEQCTSPSLVLNSRSQSVRLVFIRLWETAMLQVLSTHHSDRYQPVSHVQLTVPYILLEQLSHNDLLLSLVHSLHSPSSSVVLSESHSCQYCSVENVDL